MQPLPRRVWMPVVKNDSSPFRGIQVAAMRAETRKKLMEENQTLAGKQVCVPPRRPSTRGLPAVHEIPQCPPRPASALISSCSQSSRRRPIAQFASKSYLQTVVFPNAVDASFFDQFGTTSR